MAKGPPVCSGGYKFTGSFPGSEMYGLTSQFRRAAVSVPANIAEGFKKKGKADKIRFLNIAQGSLEESRYYLILARDPGYGDSSQLTNKLEEVSKLLEAYTNTILDSGFSKIKEVRAVSDPGKVDCGKIRELFSAMLDGELAGEDSARLEGHLLLCRQCRQEYEIWRRIAETLRSDPVSEEPSPDFCAGVMRRLAVETAPGRSLFRVLRTPAAAAAAAVMLFAGSWGVSVAVKDTKPPAVVVTKNEQGEVTPKDKEVPGDPQIAAQPESSNKTTDPARAEGDPAGSATGASPVTPTQPAPVTPGEPVKYALLVDSRKDILSTILKLSVSGAPDAGNSALALAARLGGGGQVLTTQKKGDGELVIMRITVPREAGKTLLAQLSGLGRVMDRADEKKNVTDSYNQTVNRLNEIQARIRADIPAGERSQLEAEASGLKRQIESWDQESGSHVIILWLEG